MLIQSDVVWTVSYKSNDPGGKIIRRTFTDLAEAKEDAEAHFKTKVYWREEIHYLDFQSEVRKTGRWFGLASASDESDKCIAFIRKTEFAPKADSQWFGASNFL